MDKGLNNCPFCDGGDVIQEHNLCFCNDCGASGPDTDVIGNRDPVDKWNTRHFPAGCTLEDVKKLCGFNNDLTAENQRLRSLLKEAVEYLDTNELTVISNSSILHQKFNDAVQPDR